MSHSCHCEERGVRRGNPNDRHGEVGDCRTKNVRNDKLERGFDVVTLVMHISIVTQSCSLFAKVNS